MARKEGKYIMLKFSFSHGEGHKHYKSAEAKRKYADQLLSLSGKSFLAILAPAFSLPLSDKADFFMVFVILSTVFFSGGLYFRHEGLKIYDYLAESSQQQTDS